MTSEKKEARDPRPRVQTMGLWGSEDVPLPFYSLPRQGVVWEVNSNVLSNRARNIIRKSGGGRKGSYLTGPMEADRATRKPPRKPSKLAAVLVSAIVKHTTMIRKRKFVQRRKSSLWKSDDRRNPDGVELGYEPRGGPNVIKADDGSMIWLHGKSTPLRGPVAHYGRDLYKRDNDVVTPRKANEVREAIIGGLDLRRMVLLRKGLKSMVPSDFDVIVPLGVNPKDSYAVMHGETDFVNDKSNKSKLPIAGFVLVAGVCFVVVARLRRV